MDFFTAYAIDPKLEQEGKEFDFGGGVKMLIARANNDKYNRMLTQQFEAHKHTLELNDTPEQRKAAEERSNLIMADVMAHSVLLGWTGPVKFKGEDLPYSVANAKKLLELKEFQRQVAKHAEDYRNFRFKVEEEDAKN